MATPKIISNPYEMIAWRKSLPVDKSVGFVPTMGALHAGHESLLVQSRKENDYSVLSIFVNPTQFDNADDLAKYPSTWDQDLAMAAKAGVDVIFFPEYKLMYPDNYTYKVSENDFSKKFCGAHRPGHFDGVLSVVMKLLNIVSPTHAYFGEKDYQQMTLIKKMKEAFFLPYEIKSVATLRDKDGLAMSSRNVRLTAEQRERAPLLHKILVESKTAAEASAQLTKSGFKVDYVEDSENRRLAAAFLGDVRLIDNVKI